MAAMHCRCVWLLGLPAGAGRGCRRGVDACVAVSTSGRLPPLHASRGSCRLHPAPWKGRTRTRATLLPPAPQHHAPAQLGAEGPAESRWRRSWQAGAALAAAGRCGVGWGRASVERLCPAAAPSCCHHPTSAQQLCPPAACRSCPASLPVQRQGHKGAGSEAAMRGRHCGGWPAAATASLSAGQPMGPLLPAHLSPSTDHGALASRRAAAAQRRPSAAGGSQSEGMAEAGKQQQHHHTLLAAPAGAVATAGAGHHGDGGDPARPQPPHCLSQHPRRIRPPDSAAAWRGGPAAGPAKKKVINHFSSSACHPCAGAMLIFSVSFPIYHMVRRPRGRGRRGGHGHWAPGAGAGYGRCPPPTPLASPASLARRRPARCPDPLALPRTCWGRGTGAGAGLKGPPHAPPMTAAPACRGRRRSLRAAPAALQGQLGWHRCPAAAANAGRTGMPRLHRARFGCAPSCMCCSPS